jgi:hypothetical protein
MPILLAARATGASKGVVVTSITLETPETAAPFLGF